MKKGKGWTTPEQSQARMVEEVRRRLAGEPPISTGVGILGPYRAYNYVCFTCRWSTRTGGLCPRCRGVTVQVHGEVPGKSRKKEWAKLEKRYWRAK